MNERIDPKIQLYVKIPISRYNMLQDHAALVGTTMADFVRVAISEKMAREIFRANANQTGGDGE
jgi:uncharacterized protein (DUF1778 family)